MSSPQLPPDFLSQVEALETTSAKVRWYYCVIVNLAALNYPELIPNVWKHISSHLFSSFSHDEQFQAARKFREALIKATGIIGAAKAGTAIRGLSKCIPKELKDTAAPRAAEDQAAAAERGRAFHKRIYGRNPEFDPNASIEASPDYAFVIRDLLYGRVFSFDGILDDLETGYVIVSALIGNDCHIQLRHHMKGMLYNGATRQDLEELSSLLLGLAKSLDVRFKSPSIVIPEI
ncbi:hypothetical protein GQ53DRAFT_837636 [Thozetella sp. PMI_491]|nr:hypothetical protein GQ53DRAFT_837636 [Thozetella sp. PMI_491]